MEMERIIVAFENPKSSERVREIIEGSGTALCVACRSAAEVKRAVSRGRATTVVCGFKLPDESAEELFLDLPVSCAMLMVAAQNLLELCRNEDIFKLAAPVGRGDLVASVRMLLQMGHRLERFVRPHRSGEDQSLIDEAKLLLMDRHGMTEEQAHRFLQKKSMDSGVKMVQTAKLVLGGQ